jgi:hypothetical protein
MRTAFTKWTELWKGRRYMPEFCVLIGGGLLMVGLPGLVYPALVGWRSRRDALLALCMAVTLLAIAFVA